MIVYLDQNKWIELARMVHGKDQSSRAKRVAHDFATAVDGGHIDVPLSAIHYMETSRISNVGRKVRLGSVMWRFSKGTTIVGYPVVVRHELGVAFAKHFTNVTPGTMHILGRGHSHAFGTPPLQDLLAHFEEEVERSMLVGNEVLGIEPPSSRLVQYQENFRQHLALLHARQKDVPKDMRENWLYAMSDVDILNPINDVMHKYNLPKEAMDTLGERGLKEIINNMPTRRVDLHLHRQVLRNPSYFPRLTDLEDWSGLALASCYCDVVVCEKHMADMLSRDGFRTKARIEVDLEKTFVAAKGA